MPVRCSEMANPEIGENSGVEGPLLRSLLVVGMIYSSLIFKLFTLLVLHSLIKQYSFGPPTPWQSLAPIRAGPSATFAFAPGR